MKEPTKFKREMASMPVRPYGFKHGTGNGYVDATTTVTIDSLVKNGVVSAFKFTGDDMPNNATDIFINEIGVNLNFLDQDSLHYGNITSIKIDSLDLKIICYIG